MRSSPSTPNMILYSCSSTQEATISKGRKYETWQSSKNDVILVHIQENKIMIMLNPWFLHQPIMELLAGQEVCTCHDKVIAKKQQQKIRANRAAHIIMSHPLLKQT